MLRQRLLSDQGPAEETMDNKKKKNKRNNRCCPRLFSHSNDNDTLMGDATPLIPLNAAPVSKSMKSKKITTTNGAYCCFPRTNNSYHTLRRASGRSYPGISYLDYLENKDDKPRQQKNNEQKQNHGYHHNDLSQPDHHDTLSTHDSTVEYHHLDSTEQDTTRHDDVGNKNSSVRI